MKVEYKTFAGAIRAEQIRVAKARAKGAGEILRDHILQSLTNSPARTGRIYKIPGTDKTYTASAPGEYPAMATGALRKSLNRIVRLSGNMNLGYRASLGGPRGGSTVGTGYQAVLGEGVKPYGVLLEQGKGGKPGDGIRPWFSKAADEKVGEMKRYLSERWF